MQMGLLDQSRDRQYFTIIPNLLWVDDLELRVTDFKLYATIKKVAGESGVCYMSTRTLAREAGISAGAVSEGKGRLEAAGLITIVSRPRTRGGQPIDHVTVTDIWQHNIEYFASSERCSPHEHSDTSVHQVNTSSVECSSGEHRCSSGEPEEDPLNKNQKMNKIVNYPDFCSGSAEEIWRRAQEDLKLQMERATFDRLLAASRGISLDDHTLTVGVKNESAVEWCTHRLRKDVKQALMRVVGEEVEVRFEVFRGKRQGSQNSRETRETT